MPLPMIMGGLQAASGIAGMLSGKSAAKDAKKNQAVALSNAGQSFTPINVSGPGGAGVSFNTGMGGGAGVPQGQPIPGTPYFSDGQGGKVTADGLQVVGGTRGRVKRTNISDANVSAGDLEDGRAGLAGLVNQLGTGAGQMDEGTMQALARLMQAGNQFGDAGLGGLDQLQQGGMNAFGLSAQNLGNQADFAGMLRSQGQNMLGQVPGTADARASQTLDLLRQQARPEEDRAFAGLQDNLFATGRMGTTGGGIQTEAFARGLGQADLQRQLMSQQEGRNASNFQMQQGQGMATLGDSLFGNAMNNFQNMSSLNSQLGQDRFNRTNTIAGQNFDRAGSLLATSPQFLQQSLLQQQLGNLNSGLTGVGNINNNALNFANFAQSLMGQQANARSGQQSVLNGIANQGPDMTNANMFAQLGQGFANAGSGGNGLFDSLGSLFGGGGGSAGFTPTDAAGFSPFNN